MTQKDKNNFKIGFFILGAAVIFGIGYLYITKKGFFDDTTKLYVFADDVSDLSTETPILINGFQIGSVSDLSINSGKVLIEFSVDKEIKLKKSAQFSSTGTGIFGNKVILVKKFQEGEEFFQTGDTIQTEFLILPNQSIIDSTLMKEIEPSLKEISRKVGKALLEYGEEGEKEEIIPQ